MDAARYALTIVALTVAAFVAYTIALAVCGLFMIGVQSGQPWLFIATDIAGVPFLAYAFLTVIPVATAFAGLLLPLLGCLWFERIRIVTLGGFAVFVSAIQIFAGTWVTVKFYDFRVDWDAPSIFPAIVLSVACLSIFNFALCFVAWIFRWRDRLAGN
jgi:hypothetical protein